MVVLEDIQDNGEECEEGQEGEDNDPIDEQDDVAKLDDWFGAFPPSRHSLG